MTEFSRQKLLILAKIVPRFGLLLLLVVMLSISSYQFLSTVASYQDSTYVENSTLATKDWTAPLSLATTAITSPTTSTTLLISYTAQESNLLDGQTGVDTVALWYRYKAYGAAAFGADTLFDTDNVVDAQPVLGDFTVNTSSLPLNGNGVYEFYTLATDVGGNVEEVPAVADIANFQVDNTPPGLATHLSPADASSTNSTNLQMDWGDVLDVLNAHNPVTYEFQRADDVGFTLGVSTLTGLTNSNTGVTQNGVPNGTYYWRVRVCDSLSNCSAYTSPWSVTVDNTFPVTTVTITSSPTRDIENKVANGGFESDLSGWTAVGDVAAVTQDALLGSPHTGAKMARVGTVGAGPGNSIDVNILTQTFTNNGSGSGDGLRSVGFWYNFMTNEFDAGFDEPGLMVFVGDRMVHQVWASDIPGFDSNSSTIDSTGWRYLSVDVTGVTNPTLSLAFYSGNNGDLEFNSYLYLDDVTTNEAAASSTATLTLNATDNDGIASVNYAYSLDCDADDEVTGTGASGLTFTIASQPCDAVGSYTGLIKYWAVDTATNVEAYKTFHVSIDNSAPSAVTGLEVGDESNGDFRLEWIAPGDSNPYNLNQAAQYDIRYSTSAILPTATQVELDALPTPMIRNIDGLPGGGLRSPLYAGRAETYYVHVPGVTTATYYFVVRAKDSARNTSGLDPAAGADSDGGSIDDVGAATTPVATSLPGDVVINEIMWMGSSLSASDEWVELRNMTDQAIDLTGWSIDNLSTGSSSLTITSGSIPANGYYVISKLAATNPSSNLKNTTNLVDASMDMDNTGEQLILHAPSTLMIIDETPVTSGAWTSGLNTPPIYQSMERNNVPSVGSVDGNWHNCESSSCSDAAVLYFDTLGSDFGTPEAANLSFSEKEIVPTVELRQDDADHVSFTLKGIQLYTNHAYTIEYDHQVDGQTVHEGLQGILTSPLSTREQGSDKFYLGTCSSNGTCTSHAPVTGLKITVVMTGPNAASLTIGSGLESGVVASPAAAAQLLDATPQPTQPSSGDLPVLSPETTSPATTLTTTPAPSSTDPAPSVDPASSVAPAGDPVE